MAVCTRKRQGNYQEMHAAKEVIVVEDSPQACIKDTGETPQKRKRVNVKFTTWKCALEPNPFIKKKSINMTFCL